MATRGTAKEECHSWPLCGMLGETPNRLGASGMKRIAPVWIVLLFSAVLAASARPAPKPLTLSLPFEGPVAFAVLDARPDVVKGERKETFIGFTRSLYGIPFPAHTRSKKPLAQDLANLVIPALKSGGASATAVNVSPFQGREGAVQALQASGAERLVLLEIRDWWSDTLIHTDLHYDLHLAILNAQGQELGSTSVSGHDELGKRQRPERRDLPTAINDIFATLFSAEAVMAAFSREAAPAATTAGCTVEQILKMKDAGLTQEQIEAACGSATR